MVDEDEIKLKLEVLVGGSSNEVGEYDECALLADLLHHFKVLNHEVLGR